MKNFCSISDKNYLNKVLTLYKSLINTQNSNFLLHIICLDDYTFSFFNKNKFEKINSIHIKQMENEDFSLKYFKTNNIPSNEAISNANAQKKDPKYIQFCWALAPYTCWYLLENLKIESILYIDSDLYFYKDIEEIYQEISNKSVGIIRHRIDYIESAGEYNVGIVYFNNDYAGLSCSKWWKSVLLDSKNQYAKKYGTCGDQKYLELFIPLFGSENVCVIDEKIGHLAPWNVTFHRYEEEKIVWENRKQDLFFFHFAHFVPDFENNKFKSSYNKEWIWGIPEQTNDYVKKIYDDYFLACKESNEIIKSFKE